MSLAASTVLAVSSHVAPADSTPAAAELSRELVFAHTGMGAFLLVASFCVTLVACLLPFLAMRSEQFTHCQIVGLSVWHAFVSGVLLAAAWTVFLPTVVDLAAHLALPSPALPFVMLFVALLAPLMLDKLMLWMVASRPTRPTTDAEVQNEPHTPAGTAPTTPMQRFTPRGGSNAPSRKPSVIGGTGVLGADFEERKLVGPAGQRGSVTAGRPSSRMGVDPESQPLTGIDMEAGPTPHGTPGWYGSAKLSVDALEFKAKQPYLARCAFCKDNITTNKGLAYHAAGCGLRSFHAFSFSSRWMQGLRGRRSAQREIVTYEHDAAGGERAYPGWSIACYVAVLAVYNVALAGGINFQQAALLVAARNAGDDESATTTGAWLAEIMHVLLVGLVMFCFTWFYGFSLGLMLRLHRLTLGNWRSWLAILAYACSLPLAIVLNGVVASHLPVRGGVAPYEWYLLVCQCACVGVLLYCSFVDMILEEWARRDAIWGKTMAFAVGATLVCTIAIWAPML